MRKYKIILKMIKNLLWILISRRWNSIFWISEQNDQSWRFGEDNIGKKNRIRKKNELEMFKCEINVDKKLPKDFNFFK